MEVTPYGSWSSPVTPALLVERAVSLGGIAVADGAVWWAEGRPSEEGRVVVVRRDRDGATTDVVPAGFSARSTVHEYGGGAFAVHGDDLYFSNFADQRVWRVAGAGDGRPLPVTPEPPSPQSLRFADGRVTPDGAWLVMVREQHLDGGEVVNDLVALDLEAARSASTVEPRRVAGGQDFYAAPRPSPDGRRLAWLSWDHPDMPWDGTHLWVADLGPAMVAEGARRVAGGPEESVLQPAWGPDGTLHWISDRSGWWNLYADDGGAGRPLAPMDAEFGGPLWALGQSTYDFLPDGRLVASWAGSGGPGLGLVRPDGSGMDRIESPYNAVSSLGVADGAIVAVAASAVEEPAVVVVDPATGACDVVRRSRQRSVDAGFLSAPERLEVPIQGGVGVHALYYRPANRDHRGPDGEPPPLLVTSHGGPTAAASPALNLGIQFWTSRGIAVADVDYRGSTGYGRDYRRRLDGAWGVADVDDCVSVARHLAATGEVDGDRMAIRGGSAGGYTTLCAVTFREGVFAAGASYYGVADAEALAVETHKFESRYLDRLIGPYPAARDLYRERSPIHFVDRISCPLIVFQGLDDKVVPPAQAELMVDALRRKGLPVAYVPFEGEGHGFRKAGNIRRSVEAELSFYGQVMGFVPADRLEPVAIENLPA